MPVKKIKLQIGDVIRKKIHLWGGDLLEQTDIVVEAEDNYVVVKRDNTSDTYVILSELHIEVPSGAIIGHYNKYLVSRILETEKNDERSK